MIRLKSLFCFLLLAFSFNVCAQEEVKKNVLVIAFKPYQFYSSFDLSEIVRINQIENPNEISNALIDTALINLTKKHPKFNITVIPKNEEASINHLLDPVFKSKPIPYYGINQASIWSNSQFLSLLKNYEIDYVLFLTNYVLDNKLLSAKNSFEGSFLIQWSSHQLQYEFYDKDGILKVYSNGYEVIPDAPTQETYRFKGLHFGNLGGGFRSIRKDLIKKLAQYEVTGKPVYKLKKEKKKKKKKHKK